MPDLPRGYVEETARIRKHRAQPAARHRHPFRPAKWTASNGHPRCLICGITERVGGFCPGADHDGMVTTGDGAISPVRPIDLSEALALAAELDVLEAEAAAAEMEADLATGRIPPGSRRGLLPHERRAGVNFATIAQQATDRGDRLAQRLAAERAWLAQAVDHHLAPSRDAGELRQRLAALSNPARPLGADLPDLPARLARLEADTLAEMRGSYADGWRQVAAEARSQGVPIRAITAVELDQRVDATLAAAAQQTAARPYTTGLDAATKAAARSTSTDPGTIRAAAVKATAEDGLDGLATDHARAPITQAAGAGRQAAGERLPTARTIYASELLDGSTCGPCSLVDGREYPNLDTARIDYPFGTYVRCEGGSRCRGTLVFVWDTEAAPTIDDALRPGPEAPPLGPEAPPDPPAPTTPRIGPHLPTPPPAPAAPAMSREMAQEAERQARLAARRERAAAEREAERAGLDALVDDGYTPEQVAAARRDLDHYRARARAEAKRMADEMLRELDAITGGNPYLANPPVRRRVKDAGGRIVSRRFNDDGTPYTGGSWDWLEQISDAEDKRLRRKWFRPRGERGQAPDELADTINGGTVRARSEGTEDEAIARWLDLNRRADGYDALATGKPPSQYAYGGNLDLPLPDSPYGPLLGDNVEQTRYLLERYADDADEWAERAARDQARYADDVDAPPAPWEMTEDDFVAQLADVERRYAAADPTPVVDLDETLGRPRFSDEVEALLDEYGRLVPDAVADLDLTPRDLHRAITRWARESGFDVPDAFADPLGLDDPAPTPARRPLAGHRATALIARLDRQAEKPAPEADLDDSEAMVMGAVGLHRARQRGARLA